jgi:chromosome partitioning protein
LFLQCFNICVDYVVFVVYSLVTLKGQKEMAKIISFANQKGGVGKTTTAVNIAASLAAIKKRVLLIDLDSQGNAGTGLGFVRAAHKQSVYGVLMGHATVVENILTTAVPNMHLLPASAKLAGAELDMLDLDRREYRLRDALAQVANNYDYILIDCPPALGMLTINALTASDYVIIPLQCRQAI